MSRWRLITLILVILAVGLWAVLLALNAEVACMIRQMRGKSVPFVVAEFVLAKFVNGRAHLFSQFRANRGRVGLLG